MGGICCEVKHNLLVLYLSVPLFAKPAFIVTQKSASQTVKVRLTWGLIRDLVKNKHQPLVSSPRSQRQQTLCELFPFLALIISYKVEKQLLVFKIIISILLPFYNFTLGQGANTNKSTKTSFYQMKQSQNDVEDKNENSNKCWIKRY